MEVQAVFILPWIWRKSVCISVPRDVKQRS
nr:MAG TPA: hypothetical protein [Caudoviricetes sp.]